MNMRHYIGRLFYGLLTGFDFVTLCWIGWGIATPGDSFANDNPWVNVSLLSSALAGFALGCIQKSKVFRVLVAVLAVAALLFDLFAPSDWWVKPLLPSKSELMVLR